MILVDVHELLKVEMVFSSRCGKDLIKIQLDLLLTLNSIFELVTKHNIK